MAEFLCQLSFNPSTTSQISSTQIPSREILHIQYQNRVREYAQIEGFKNAQKKWAESFLLNASGGLIRQSFE